MSERRNIPRTICPTFWLGDIVYLKVDSDAEPGMVTRISLMVNDHYMYQVSWGNGVDSNHYDIELDTEPNHIHA